MNTKKKQKGKKKWLAIALSLLIVTGVAYAAVTSTLSINGSGTLLGSGFNVHFENLDAGNATGTGVKGTAGTADTNSAGASFMTINVSGVQLAATGDSVTYTFDIKNDGSKSANLGTPAGPGLTFTGIAPNKTADESVASAGTTFAFTTAGGSAIPSTIAAGATINCKVVITYSNGTQLPSNDVAISGSWTIAVTPGS